MDWLWILLALAFVAGIVWFAVTRRKSARTERTLSYLPIKYPDSIPYTYSEAGKPFISSVVPVSPEAQEAIAEGIRMTIKATELKFPHWNKVRNLPDYNVLLIDPEATNMDGSPALIYRTYGLGAQEIQTAGTIIGTGADKVSPTNIVLPHQQATNWSHLTYLRNSARHEAEHYAELYNDINMFRQYATSGDVHPHHLLPEEQVLRGFASSVSNSGCLSVDENVKPMEGMGSPLKIVSPL